MTIFKFEKNPKGVFPTCVYTNCKNDKPYKIYFIDNNQNSIYGMCLCENHLKELRDFLNENDIQYTQGKETGFYIVKPISTVATCIYPDCESKNIYSLSVKQGNATDSWNLCETHLRELKDFLNEIDI